MTLDEFNNELLTIGGGYVNGMARLRCVSALTETKFACGSQKIKYPRASKTEERWLWGLRDTTTGITTAKTEQEVIDNKDPQMFGVRKLLSRTVTWIGYPNYVVEYYRSPLEMKDGPFNWEKNRYDYWFNPETKRREWTDINGPWPDQGRYDLLMVVKTGEGVWGQFRELGDDILEEVRKAIRWREEFKKVKSDEECIRDMVEAQEAKEDRLEAEMADQIEQEIGPAWRRAIKDNPRLFVAAPKPNNKLTKHGRAT